MEIITRLDAAKAGLKRYYTGKKCKHGHDSERYHGPNVIGLWWPVLNPAYHLWPEVRIRIAIRLSR